MPKLLTGYFIIHSKSSDFKFNAQYESYSEDYLKKYYRHEDKKGRFLDRDLTAKGLSGGGYEYEWKGVKNIWRCPKKTMDKYDKENRLYYTKNGTPRLKQYLNEKTGVTTTNIWTDIPPINSQAKERLGYPTQKPEALLERIIMTSSNEGDYILDPFCGCGTTVSVAQKLNRKWVGIDITALAINLVRHRIYNQFGKEVKIYVDGLPKDLQGTTELFNKDPFEFQYWALDLINAMPTRGKSKDTKRGADKGIDGIITFKDTDKFHKVIYKKIIVSVKGGKNISVRDIRDLKGVVEREKSEGGILVTLHEPTKPMHEEANISGFFRNNFFNKEFPKIQILTVGDLLNGRKPEIPSGVQEVEYFKKASKSNVQKRGKQKRLFGESV